MPTETAHWIHEASPRNRIQRHRGSTAIRRVWVLMLHLVSLLQDLLPQFPGPFLGACLPDRLDIVLDAGVVEDIPILHLEDLDVVAVEQPLIVNIFVLFARSGDLVLVQIEFLLIFGNQMACRLRNIAA